MGRETLQTLEALRRRTESAEDLHSIVKTMKALAAVNIRQYEKAVEALAEFNRTTELGLHVVLADRAEDLMEDEPVRGKGLGVVLFGSDQGMCGQFNEQISSFALAGLNSLIVEGEERAVQVVGVRPVPYLEDAGWAVEQFLSLPGSATGISRLVQTLLLTIDEWRRERGIQRVYLFYNRLYSTTSYRPQMVRLLPIEIERLKRIETKQWPSRNLPVYTMPRNQLLSSLIRQYLFVVLYRACAESQASENAARLTAMQAAEKNIEERLVELTTLYHNQRQNSITSELLDIVSGFEVLTG